MRQDDPVSTPPFPTLAIVKQVKPSLGRNNGTGATLHVWLSLALLRVQEGALEVRNRCKHCCGNYLSRNHDLGEATLKKNAIRTQMFLQRDSSP